MCLLNQSLLGGFLNNVCLPGLKLTAPLEVLADLFVTHGAPAYIRSDNGPEFTAGLVRAWLEALAVETLFIERGSPWENGTSNRSTGSSAMNCRGGPRNSDRLLRWDPDPGEGVWNATKETELSG